MKNTPITYGHLAKGISIIVLGALSAWMIHTIYILGYNAAPVPEQHDGYCGLVTSNGQPIMFTLNGSPAEKRICYTYDGTFLFATTTNN